MKLGPRIVITTGVFTLFVVLIGIRGFWVQSKLSKERISRVQQTVAAETLALRAQAALKTQVQEWKNVLLRGAGLEAYDKYYEQFNSQEASTRLLMAQRVVELPNGSLARELVGPFLRRHLELAQKYETGLVLFRQFDRQNPLTLICWFGASIETPLICVRESWKH